MKTPSFFLTYLLAGFVLCGSPSKTWAGLDSQGVYSLIEVATCAATQPSRIKKILIFADSPRLARLTAADILIPGAQSGKGALLLIPEDPEDAFSSKEETHLVVGNIITSSSGLLFSGGNNGFRIEMTLPFQFNGKISFNQVGPEFECRSEN
ncbi:hypothetical protein K2X30_03270 [bacterium]|nr:hypothetical protein [bacterium]